MLANLPELGTFLNFAVDDTGVAGIDPWNVGVTSGWRIESSTEELPEEIPTPKFKIKQESWFVSLIRLGRLVRRVYERDMMSAKITF